MKINLSKIIYAAIVILSFNLSACSQDIQEVIMEPTLYDGCCGTEIQTYQVEDYHVYIPNIITPNGDGINDVFYPICSEMVRDKFGVSDLWISNDTGKVIFVLQALDVEAARTWGFKGWANHRPFNPDQSLLFEHTGKFKYSCNMYFKKKDGTIEELAVKGEGCVVRCDEDAKVIKGKDGCYFPIQGLNGRYDPSIPNKEDNCIK